MPAPTRAVSPVFRAVSDLESPRLAMRLCRPAPRAAPHRRAIPPRSVAPALANPRSRRRAGAQARELRLHPKRRFIMSAKTVEIVPQSGSEIFIPLNKLKKSPKNARKTPHSEAAVEAYAASIAAKGILQNLVVEPKLYADSASSGFYFVTTGEGRRLAQLLRVKCKDIKKTEPIRCVIDT